MAVLNSLVVDSFHVYIDIAICAWFDFTFNKRGRQSSIEHISFEN